MRMILLSLATSACLFSSAAQAQDADGQQEEMQCTFDMLTEDDRERVGIMLIGSDEEAAVVQEQAVASMELASAACAATFGWQEHRHSAGAEYAMARVSFEIMYNDLPADWQPDRMEAVYDSFPEDVRDGFAYAVQSEMSDDDFDAWMYDAQARLSAAGVSDADLPACMLYLNAYGDLAITVAVWRALFERGML